jgi:hypothetical protein
MSFEVLNMALLIGQAIDGRELEQATSPWPPERFASMCNALAWVVSGRQCPGVPSFTIRVNAKDGGIDAELSVELPGDDRPVPTPIVGPGWNVFQYKKRDLIALEVVLPEAATLSALSPALLVPGLLPGLWQSSEITLKHLYEYFSGGRIMKIQREGYEEPVTIPEAERALVESAVRTAV